MSNISEIGQFALVLWVEENNTSILDSKFLNDKQLFTDSERVGLVEHGTVDGKKPKEGWKAYPARVLCVSDNMVEIQDVEAAWLEKNKTRKETTNLGKGLRNKRKTTKLQEEDEQIVILTDTNSNKAKRQKQVDATRQMNEEILKNLDSGLVSNPPTATSKNADAAYYDEESRRDMRSELKSDLAAAKAEITKLKAFNFQLQEDLPRLVESTIKKCLRRSKEESMKEEMKKPKPSPVTTKFIETQNDGPSQAEEPSPQQEDPVKDENYWRHNLRTLLEYEVLAEVERSKGYKKLTRNLMKALFTVHELITCSVTTVGHKEPLDKAKVDIILGFVQAKYCEIDAPAIKAVMAQKLKDERIHYLKVINGNKP